MLYKFTHTNNYGNLRHRIIYRPEGKELGFNPKNFGPFVNVEVFKYKYEHSYLPPHLFVSNDGQKYIVPIWKKVLPETTLEDIEWVKPKTKKVRVEKQEFKFESKSDPGHFYNVTVKGDEVDCTCAGKWRAKDRQKGCTHMQQVRKQLGI